MRHLKGLWALPCPDPYPTLAAGTPASSSQRCPLPVCPTAQLATWASVVCAATPGPARTGPQPLPPAAKGDFLRAVVTEGLSGV